MTVALPSGCGIAPPSAAALPPVDAGGFLYVLHPGDVACGERGDRFETLLGSCVSIILTDPRRTVGAMCHIVHSSRGETRGAGETMFADVALARMYALLRSRGITPQLCDAWAFGGGNMFPRLYGGGSHVGENNVRWVRDTLAREGLRVIDTDLGGNTYRRVRWTVGPESPVVRAEQV